MFSIIVPMYNASDTIVKTLDSCIHQTYLPKEIIVIDDRSSDDSVVVVQEWKEHYKGQVEIVLQLLEVNSGPSKARNAGWDLATGEYVAFLDADDRFMAHKLETIASVLKKNEEIVLLGHKYTLNELEKTGVIGELQKIDIHHVLLKNLATTPSVIVKRQILERFDETMRYTEDHDLWLRITEHYDKTYFLESTLTIIDRPVRSKGGQSANLWAMRKGEITMYKKFCKRNSIMLLFPLFIAFSLSKHILKILKG